MTTLTPTPEIQVFAPGSVVTLKTGHEAKIISATVYAGRRITYRAVWLDQRQRCEAEIEAFEIVRGPRPYSLVAQAAVAVPAVATPEIAEPEIHKIGRPKIHRPTAA